MSEPTFARCRIVITGTVTGVGLRYHSRELAQRLNCTGFVRNGTNAVTIEVEGSQKAVHEFIMHLHHFPPTFAHFTSFTTKDIPAAGDTDFYIL